jgi:hypothetical protein
MRTVRTFVLRLFCDTEEPDALRGAIQAVSDQDSHAFPDEQALIELLHEMVIREGEEHHVVSGREEGIKSKNKNTTSLGKQ